jgi:hypothetical protein
MSDERGAILEERTVTDKEFPMIGEDGKPSVSVPWYVGEALYRLYSELYGTAQSIERISERGGFGYRELYHMAVRRQQKIARGNKP